MTTQTNTAPLPPIMEKGTAKELRDARDLDLYNEYKSILAEHPNATRTSINTRLMVQFNLHSTGTLYVILKRVETRLGIKKSIIAHSKRNAKAKKGGRK